VSFYKSYLANEITVEDLENLIKTEFAESLSGVAEECWSPALAQFFDTGLCQCHPEAIDDVLVFGWIYL
jgi:hypothetical protein